MLSDLWNTVDKQKRSFKELCLCITVWGYLGKPCSWWPLWQQCLSVRLRLVKRRRERRLTLAEEDWIEGKLPPEPLVSNFECYWSCDAVASQLLRLSGIVLVRQHQCNLERLVTLFRLGSVSLTVTRGSICRLLKLSMVDKPTTVAMYSAKSHYSIALTLSSGKWKWLLLSRTHDTPLYKSDRITE